MTKKELRSNFTDFRYLDSSIEGEHIREFVRYEEVVALMKDLGLIEDSDR